MIPKLNWNRKNIGKLILFHELLGYEHSSSHVTKPKKKIKNNQFNVKWFLNRFLFSYYQRRVAILEATKPAKHATQRFMGNNRRLNSLSFIENRLDIILFRTNWFISYHHVNHAILTGKISLNNKIVSNKNIFIKKGDIIKVDEGFLLWKKKEIKYENEYSGSFGQRPQYSFRFYKNGFKNYMDWFKNKYYFLLKNPVYLEVNCNIKTIIILKNPQYQNIPYPKNLARSAHPAVVARKALRP